MKIAFAIHTQSVRENSNGSHIVEPAYVDMRSVAILGFRPSILQGSNLTSLVHTNLDRGIIDMLFTFQK